MTDFPELDFIDQFVIDNGLWIYPAVFAIAVAIGVCVAVELAVSFKTSRSPVEKLLREKGFSR